MRVMTVGYIDFKSYPPTRYLSKILPFTKKWLQKRFIKIIQKSEIINENIGYIYDDVNYWNATKSVCRQINSYIERNEKNKKMNNFKLIVFSFLNL